MADRLHQIYRQNLRRLRKKLSLNYQQRCSTKICQTIKRLDVFRYAKHIALYHAINGEIDLGDIFKSATTQEKFCYFPALTDSGSLNFLPATPATENVSNKFGIPEPDTSLSNACRVTDLDIIFMPLVGFDHQGNRLGMGAGYYDKTLIDQQGPLLIGVAYAFQQLSWIKTHSGDVPLDGIITESGLFNPSGRLT